MIYTHLRVPILQSPGEPERAGEARRADSASSKKEEAPLCVSLEHSTLNIEDSLLHFPISMAI